MYVRVRTMDGKRTCSVSISKLTTVQKFRELVHEQLDVPADCQRLFFRGKQMEDGHTMFEYGANVNDVIQLMVRQAPPPVENGDAAHESTQARRTSDTSQTKVSPESRTAARDKDATPAHNGWRLVDDDEYFQPDDLCDAREPASGGWFEAVVRAVRRSASAAAGDPPRTQYSVQFEGYEEDPAVWVEAEEVRERAAVTLPVGELQPGADVLVNYNVDEPAARGFWFDAVIQSVQKRGAGARVTATLELGAGRVPLAGCVLPFPDEVMARGRRRRRALRSAPADADDAADADAARPPQPPSARRELAAQCRVCRDRPERSCRECGCQVCHSKARPEQQVMCDECDRPYHIDCLTPPLPAIPDEDDWYCPECKTDTSEVVQAGQKLKSSQKRAKMASQVNKTKRDWGKGMATAGRQKVCSIVPLNHVGPVPGVEVGMRWQYRLQASEAGVHRPHVAGIAGREKEGAFSIVLSGGYEDDVDNGEEFFYTGSGGRDLSGNKRTAGQTCDQQLTRMNRALALNCHTPVNAKTGGSAGDEWRRGRPIRVVRSYKLAKHSDYAPPEGLRYDGLYKIVRYWPEAGKSGFLVWRYLMRRDDPTPAPWTPAGRCRIRELGIQDMLRVEAPEATASESDSPAAKRPRAAAYTPDADVSALIAQDVENKQLWDACRDTLQLGKLRFLDQVKLAFECSCCQELVCPPVTLPCQHNICLPCLRRSFKAEVFSCPSCRHELGKKYQAEANEPLFAALQRLFPGYQQGR